MDHFCMHTATRSHRVKFWFVDTSHIKTLGNSCNNSCLPVHGGCLTAEHAGCDVTQPAMDNCIAITASHHHA